ncbi:zinc ribbon domain-containing protein [Paludisphaera rhizosphaerae]|uniref:hypothetical protein n=1 Tax=Paludisphaera rhizosphaerae TaxID=2711216 RepID=UPI0013ED716E|nr:hypothetical protein [Paludisphaera rhizosphaerae]
MSIVFFCSECGSRFEVSDQAAGKLGRCKKCGQKITVPLPKPVAVAAGSAGDEEGGGPAWLEHMSSQVALAPLTIDRMPGVRKRDVKAPPIDDDLGDSKPYNVVEDYSIPALKAAHDAAGPAGRATIMWRHSWRSIAKLLRNINEFAYLLSIPFIMLLLIGATMHNRSLALLGAEAVVLLNIGRLITGLANLVAVPFREGPGTGLMFLIPPFTIKYMMDHWNQMRRPTKRVVTPLLTIAAVLLAFALLPSLSAKSADKDAAKPKFFTLDR